MKKLGLVFSLFMFTAFIFASNAFATVLYYGSKVDIINITSSSYQVRYGGETMADSAKPSVSVYSHVFFNGIKKTSETKTARNTNYVSLSNTTPGSGFNVSGTWSTHSYHSDDGFATEKYSFDTVSWFPN